MGKNMIYKILVINGCLSLIISGIIIGIKLNSITLGLANVMVGIANLIFMWK